MARQKTSNAVEGNLKRAIWLKRFHQWHWISSALCMLAMVMFSFTGITLNHATQIEAKAVVINRKAVLPAALQENLRSLVPSSEKTSPPLPASVRTWIAANISVLLEPAQSVEWTADEVNIQLPRPGGDAWLRIGLADGAVEYESTDRGWISWLNDLHKGRNTGPAWNWFIDIFAVSCLIFALTGLLILKFHASTRPSTWPIVGLGVLLPLLLIILFIH